jgi:tyrosinase
MTTTVLTTGGAVKATVHHRRSVDKLSAQQLDDLRKAIAAVLGLRDTRGYQYFAGWHGVAFGWCEHHNAFFLPWHRQYLYYFELALRDQVPNVSLPWWDWTVDSGIPNAYAAPKVGNKANPLVSAPIEPFGLVSTQPPPQTHRNPGANPGVPSLPYKTFVDQAMKATTFTAFTQAITPIHDWVHVWVGGTMSDVDYAAYDPLFWAHHTMVDRLWRIWQHHHAGALPPQNMLDVPLRPNGMTVRQTLSVTQLGYDYAGTAAHAPGTH